MLQSGMRATMGVKLLGKGNVTLETLEEAGLQVERLLKEVPSVKAETVAAERIVGKPYLELEIDRRAIARYGVNIRQVQQVIETAMAWMRKGMQAGVTPPRVTLRDVPQQIRNQLVDDPSESPLLAAFKQLPPGVDSLQQESLRERAHAAFSGKIAPAFEALRVHLAFFADRVDECWVDDERARAQPGGFYGGWITSDLDGPFKGDPGTGGW